MDKKKAAAAAAVAAAAAAGMVTGAVFDRPADLLADQAVVSQCQQTDDDGDTADMETERQRGPAAKVRQWILGLPAGVRMLVCVPLWCLGWVLLTGLSTFWAGAVTPLLARVLGWVCLAVILLAVLAVSVKAAFPRVPLRKLISFQNILYLLLLTLLLAAADLALPSVWAEYGQVSQFVWRVGATCLLAFACGYVLKRQGRQAAPVQAPPADGRTEIQEEARRLADTVCGDFRTR